MKTLLLKLMWSLSMVLLITSCSKDVPIQMEPIGQQKLPIDLVSISSQDGILIFKTRSDFENTVKYLNNKDLGFVRDWSQKQGIRSQELIYQEINQAENACVDKQASKLDPNITFEQFKEAGLTWDHSNIYNEYLRKGLIIEITDPDGCIWFKHNTLNPTLMPVLNEQGFVMINDTLFQYTSNQVKFSPQGLLSQVPIMVKANETISDQNIIVLNYTTRTKLTGGDWSNSTGWEYDGSKKRIKVEVVAQCPSSGEPEQSAFVTFYLEVTSHKKVLWTWKVRNSYMPINTTQGSWSWFETYIENGYPLYNWTDHYTGTHYYNNFPWSGYTNYCKFYLNPNGWVGGTGTDRLVDFGIDYTFSVVADDYNTNDLTVTD